MHLLPTCREPSASAVSRHIEKDFAPFRRSQKQTEAPLWLLLSTYLDNSLFKRPAAARKMARTPSTVACASATLFSVAVLLAAASVAPAARAASTCGAARLDPSSDWPSGGGATATLIAPELAAFASYDASSAAASGAGGNGAAVVAVTVSADASSSGIVITCPVVWDTAFFADSSSSSPPPSSAAATPGPLALLQLTATLSFRGASYNLSSPAGLLAASGAVGLARTEVAFDAARGAWVEAAGLPCRVLSVSAAGADGGSVSFLTPAWTGAVRVNAVVAAFDAPGGAGTVLLAAPLGAAAAAAGGLAASFEAPFVAKVELAAPAAGVVAASLGSTSGDLINVTGSGFGARQSLADIYAATFAGWNDATAPAARDRLRAASSQVQLSFASAYNYAPQAQRACVDVTLWSPTLVTCRAPPGAGGSNNTVTVTVASGATTNATSAPMLDAATGRRALLTYGRAALSGAVPGGGPAKGGFTVMLRGSNLANSSVVIPPVGGGVGGGAVGGVGGGGAAGSNATQALNGTSASGSRLMQSLLDGAATSMEERLRHGEAAVTGDAAAVARRLQGSCTGSTYSYGSGSCAGCAAGATFVSASAGCAPATSPTDTAFYLSGGAAEGVAAFAASGGTPLFEAGPFGAANGALVLANGSYLAAPGASAPAMLPAGGSVAWSASAWVKCMAPSTYAAALEWGAAGDGNGAASAQAVALVVAETGTAPFTTVVSTIVSRQNNFYATRSAAVIQTTGSIVVPDGGRVRLVSPAGFVSTLAGSDVVYGFADGLGTAASFNSLHAAAWIPSPGVVVLADNGNNNLRIVTLAGLVTTLAGGFNNPQAVAVHPSSAIIYVANTFGNDIRSVSFPAGIVLTLAGSGAQGSADGTGTVASFNWPQGLAVVPSSGNIIVTDSYNGLIRQITPSGAVSTLAGSGVNGQFADGVGSSAMFFKPAGAAVIPQTEAIVVTDTYNGALRHITPAGVVTTIAGPGFGLPRNPLFGYLQGVDITPSGAFVVTEDLGDIKLVTPTSVLPACDATWRHVALTFSPSATPPTLSGFLDGTLAFQKAALVTLPAASASTLRVGWSSDLSTNGGSLFAGSLADMRIYGRALSAAEVAALALPPPSPTPSASVSPSPTSSIPSSPSPSISTSPTPSSYPSASPRTLCVGSTYSYGSPACARCDAGATFVSASLGCAPLIAPLDTAFYLSGTRTEGVTAFIPIGPVSFAPDHRGVADGAISFPSGSLIKALGNFAPPALPSNGTAFSAVAWINCAATQILPNVVLSWGAGTKSSTQGYGSMSPQAIVLAAVNVAASPTMLVVTNIAGQGQWGFADGTGTAAVFSNPRGIAMFPNTRNLVVADELNDCIRFISESGVVTTPAASTNFNHPLGVAVDATSSTVAVTDSWNNRIKLVSLNGTVTTLAGSGSIGDADGVGIAASFSKPYGIAFVPSSRSFVVADTGNNLIRLVGPSGSVTTLAGGNPAALVDGMGTAARFSSPLGVAVIPSTEVVIVVDSGNNCAHADEQLRFAG